MPPAQAASGTKCAVVPTIVTWPSTPWPAASTMRQPEASVSASTGSLKVTDTSAPLARATAPGAVDATVGGCDSLRALPTR